MLDVAHLPSRTKGSSVCVYSAGQSGAGVTDLQLWKKPRGVSMVYIFCCGGGGGGGAGFAANAGIGAGGGGGGSSSPHSCLLIPAASIPDQLYVQVGFGGRGVASATGGDGSASTVYVSPARGTFDHLIYSSGSGAGKGGVSSTSTAGGNAGASGTVQSRSNLSGAGIWFSCASPQGIAGSAQGAVGGDSLILSGSGGQVGCLTFPGGGGAGKLSADKAGGGVTSSTGVLSEIRPSAAAAVSNPGSSGPAFWGHSKYPMVSFGGCGGAASNSGVGGAGGNGGWGSGGGGGGAGVGTGGRGGDGGNGLVVIISW